MAQHPLKQPKTQLFCFGDPGRRKELLLIVALFFLNNARNLILPKRDTRFSEALQVVLREGWCEACRAPMEICSVQDF